MFDRGPGGQIAGKITGGQLHGLVVGEHDPITHDNRGPGVEAEGGRDLLARRRNTDLDLDTWRPAGGETIAGEPAPTGGSFGPAESVASEPRRGSCAGG